MKEYEDILGKIVTVKIDRPLGSSHPVHEALQYPINYGFVEGVAAGDGEAQDAYVMGPNAPVETFTGQVIAVIRRRNDVEDKWVVAPEGTVLGKDAILEATKFQERFFDSEIILAEPNQEEETNRMEELSIPGTGGIVVKEVNSSLHILLQERRKPDAPLEMAQAGVLEIPAGKIRAFENIFDALRREIFEETGLSITEIEGEEDASTYEADGYKVINFAPFACAQNTAGTYPVMVLVFVCHATGELLRTSSEARNFRWVDAATLSDMLRCEPESFYPMHVHTLRKFVRIRRGRTDTRRPDSCSISEAGA